MIRHGRSAYSAGCRCQTCREAERAYRAVYRNSTTTRYSSSPFVISPGIFPTKGMFRDGTLASSCWCERRMVRVSSDDVLNGRTAPCGHPECKSPQEQAA